MIAQASGAGAWANVVIGGLLLTLWYKVWRDTYKKPWDRH